MAPTLIKVDNSFSLIEGVIMLCTVTHAKIIEFQNWDAGIFFPSTDI